MGATNAIPPSSFILHPSSSWGPGTRLGVIGGSGEMGSLFTKFFQGKGYRVQVADPKTGGRNEDVIRSSDVVLFAVPLHRAEEIIAELVPVTRPGQLLMDLTSLKVGPVREMLRSPASVVGLHPMFGGRISSFAGQTLVACPVRIDPSEWAVFHDLFTQAEIRIKECTPEEHDRMMAIIQVLFHMTTMLTGRVLRDFGVDIGQTMEYTSPVYRLEINLLGRMFAQSGALYSAITGMNPHTGELIDLLQEGLSSYRKWYDARDLDCFVEDFQKSAAHLGGFCRQAFGESQELLDFGVRLANGKESQRSEVRDRRSEVRKDSPT